MRTAKARALLLINVMVDEVLQYLQLRRALIAHLIITAVSEIFWSWFSTISCSFIPSWAEAARRLVLRRFQSAVEHFLLGMRVGKQLSF